MAYSRIKMTELFPIFEDLPSDALILDVRRADEFSGGRVPGARHIPFNEVAAHAADLKAPSAVYVYCQAGARSQRACDVLAGLGLTNLVCIVDSGWPEWALRGYPIER